MTRCPFFFAASLEGFYQDWRAKFPSWAVAEFDRHTEPAKRREAWMAKMMAGAREPNLTPWLWMPRNPADCWTRYATAGVQP